MPTYAYDDFGITLTRRADGTHDLLATCPDGSRLTAVFEMPLTADELEATILGMARSRNRKAATSRSVVVAERATREVGPGAAIGNLDTAGTIAGQRDAQAELLGAALAGALFDGDVGVAYDRARRASAADERGLRLTLTLGDAPDLLSLPWEFLYRRPRFLASQRHTPLVRRMRVETPDEPPEISDRVRILGVVASPTDLNPLDTPEERRRVEAAVAPMIADGRVELDWLSPATPRRLREALRDERYHVLHYVGHSDFAGDEGMLYLEDEHRRAAPVDTTLLANLLSDQTGLRLVVLNSCEGARNTLLDPYAGIATTLIQLGVPAVVAMQFEISDAAAILFADELYTNLIGRQDPIDSAVAEARKAILVEIDRVEWATPVLFVRDPDVDLFRFNRPAAPLPPPPPRDLSAEVERIEEPEPRRDDTDDTPDDTADAAAVAAVEPVPAPQRRTLVQRFQAASRQRLVVAAAGAGAATLTALVLIGLFIEDGETAAGPGTTAAATSVAMSPSTSVASEAPIPSVAPVDSTPVDSTPVDTAQTENTTAVTTATTPSATTSPPRDPAPRPRFGNLAVQLVRDSGEMHLKSLDLNTGVVGNLTDRLKAIDTQADWDPNSARIVFVRFHADDGVGTRIMYAADSDLPNGIEGKGVAALIPWQPGQFDHAPAWRADGGLLYASTDGCAAGRACADVLRLATFDVVADARGFLDELRLVDDRVLPAMFTGVTSIVAHPTDADLAAIADSSGVWFVRAGGEAELVLPDVAPGTMAFSNDGERLVVIASELGQRWIVLDAGGNQVATTEQPRPLATWLSISPFGSGRRMLALSAGALDDSGARLALVDVADDGSVQLVRVVNTVELPAGVPRAIDL